MSEKEQIIAVTAIIGKSFGANDHQLRFYLTDRGWAEIGMNVSSRPPRLFTREEFEKFRVGRSVPPSTDICGVTPEEFDMMLMELQICGQ